MDQEKIIQLKQGLTTAFALARSEQLIKRKWKRKWLPGENYSEKFNQGRYQ